MKAQEVGKGIVLPIRRMASAYLPSRTRANLCVPEYPPWAGHGHAGRRLGRPRGGRTMFHMLDILVPSSGQPLINHVGHLICRMVGGFHDRRAGLLVGLVYSRGSLASQYVLDEKHAVALSRSGRARISARLGVSTAPGRPRARSTRDSSRLAGLFIFG